MRTILTIMLICFISNATIAQDNVNQKEMVGFGCYFEGSPTKTVIKFDNLLKDRNYKAISKLLTSKNSGKKYLAIISLQRLSNNGQYNLSDNEKNLIANAKLSEEMVSVCSGCTYFDKVPMKDILKDDNNLIGSKRWLDGRINAP